MGPHRTRQERLAVERKGNVQRLPDRSAVGDFEAKAAIADVDHARGRLFDAREQLLCRRLTWPSAARRRARHLLLRRNALHFRRDLFEELRRIAGLTEV